MTISLGAVMGGPEKTFAGEICRSIMSQFCDKCKKDRPTLNVVFHFPGSLLKPKYTGLRTGRFSSKEQTFMIQVAVPEEIAVSSDPVEAKRFFIESISKALELSRSRRSKHKIEFPYMLAYEAIESIASNSK